MIVNLSFSLHKLIDEQIHFRFCPGAVFKTSLGPDHVFRKPIIPYIMRKKETLAQMFSCEFREIPKITFFTEHPWTTASDA